MTTIRTALRPAPPTSAPRTVGRVVLGAALLFAGVAHLTFARREFQAQVPSWLPIPPDAVVVLSGVVEIALGGALIVLGRRRIPIGWVVAAFFVAVFPGNVAQAVEQRDGFGLDTDAARLARLPFQLVLVAAALWTTAAWRDRRRLWR
jgi:uncharacterized membrane protein